MVNRLGAGAWRSLGVVWWVEGNCGRTAVCSDPLVIGVFVEPVWVPPPDG